MLAFALCMCVCGCYDADEPNDIMYAVAVGIDQSKTEGEYAFTLQFAKPAQISGGASMEGGKSGSETFSTVTVNAPTIYSAMNLANHIVSKRFTLAHTKLILFSEAVAKNGVMDMADTIARSSDIRPNIYLAVAKGTAKEYLNNIKPVVEINPEKYYQLIFENDYSGYIPKNLSQDFYFYMNSQERSGVLPIAAIQESSGGGEQQGSSGGGSGDTQTSGGGQGGQSQEQGQAGQSQGQQQGQLQGGSQEQSGGGQGGQSQGGSQDQSQEQQGQSQGQQDQSQSQSQGQSGGGEQGQKNQGSAEENQQIPLNKQPFEYNVKDYIAGNMDVEKENDAEVMGLAVFHGDKMIGELNSIESQLYSMATGEFRNSYTTYYSRMSPDYPTTLHLEQERHPIYTIDTSGDRPKVGISLSLEGDFISISPYEYLENHMGEYEKELEEYTKAAMEKFLNKTADELGTDIVGFGSFAKGKFKTHKEFDDYRWMEKYPNAEFEVKVSFNLRGTGMIIRNEEEGGEKNK